MLACAAPEVKSSPARARGGGKGGGRLAGLKVGGSGGGSAGGGNHRVLPPEPFPRKRAPDESRGWGSPGPVTTPRSATAAGGNGSSAFASFDRNGGSGGGGFRGNGRGAGDFVQTIPRAFL